MSEPAQEPSSDFLTGLAAAEDLMLVMFADPDWAGQVGMGFAATFDQHLSCLRDPPIACMQCKQILARHPTSEVQAELELGTFPEWLNARYPGMFATDEFGGDSYLRHEAAAIMRAARRGGFKTSETVVVDPST